MGIAARSRSIMARAPAVVILTMLTAGLPMTASAASLKVLVRNDAGAAVADAVVQAFPRGGGPGAAAQPAEAIIDQRDKEFIPYVTTVRVGTRVKFPNSDNIRHHVYSFSPAKTFAIPLYKDLPPEPIVFDKPGIVALGCNIHDWMSAYVFVSETPHFAMTGQDGWTTVKNLPAGRYVVEVWHPRLKGTPQPATHEVTLGRDGNAELAFVIEQKRVFRVPRMSSTTSGGYR